MRIELTPRPRRYEYDEVNEGEIFSISDIHNGEEFYVMHLTNDRRLAAVSLHDGSRLRMKGSATVTVYDKKFIKDY